MHLGIQLLQRVLVSADQPMNYLDWLGATLGQPEVTSLPIPHAVKIAEISLSSLFCNPAYLVYVVGARKEQDGS